MSNFRSKSRSSLTACLAVLALAASSHPLAAQQSTSQFIGGVENAIANVTNSLPAGTHGPLIFGGANMFAYGLGVANWGPYEINYLDGLKAAGVQKVEFNPAVTTISYPGDAAILDVMVRHARQLGMLLAINPEFNVGEFPVSSFSDFTSKAAAYYPQLVARYQPDYFVIVHEPSTQTARMGISATPTDWAQFVEQMEPLIKAASPHTLVGAGDCSHCNEDAYFQAFAAVPTCSPSNVTSGCLDFMTMDLYSDASADFSEDAGWAQTARNSGKFVYMEETFAPHDLGNVPPGGVQSNPLGAEAYSLVGTCDVVFEGLDQDWLSGMAQFDMAYGMQAMTTFTTQTFFLYSNGPVPYDESSNPTYLRTLAATLSPANGSAQLTATGAAYAAQVQQYGIKTVTSISNASYATLPSIFCGGNSCNPNSTVAPDMIVSAFGADLANQSIYQSSFPTTLGGSSATLVDSANHTFAVPIYSVVPTQLNYLVPNTNSNGDTLANGPANLTITSGDGTMTTGVVLVAPVAPGLYTSFANGQGPASAIAVCAGTCSAPGWQPNPQVQGQFYQYTFVPGCTSGTCTAPITWGPNDNVIVELYGTGFRHLGALSNITASIGTTTLPVEYAGAQGNDLGLDQVNVFLPQNLHGAGQVTVSLSVKDTVNNVTDATRGSANASQSLICINPVILDLQ